MNDFCIKECPRGKEKSEELLDKNNSALDAAMDMYFFIEKCLETCPYRDKLKIHKK